MTLPDRRQPEILLARAPLECRVSPRALSAIKLLAAEHPQGLLRRLAELKLDSFVRSFVCVSVPRRSSSGSWHIGHVSWRAPHSELSLNPAFVLPVCLLYALVLLYFDAQHAVRVPCRDDTLVLALAEEHDKFRSVGIFQSRHELIGRFRLSPGARGPCSRPS